MGGDGAGNPYQGVAIVAVHNTRQARRLEGIDSEGICLEAARAVIDKAGVQAVEVDGVVGVHSRELTYALGLGPVWSSETRAGIRAVLEAAAAIRHGLCETVVVAGGGAGYSADPEQTAAWTRPENEFVAPFGLYTAVHYALLARRHMDRFGTTPEQLATVAASIRNNGSQNPEAVYFGRGPFTVDDILASPMVAEPFHRLDCAATSEGGCALLLTSEARARDLVEAPVVILGAGTDLLGPSYRHASQWHPDGDAGSMARVGERAARRAFAQAGLTPQDVDCLELYDPFSFEVIRQLEAFGFCGYGEGGDFVEGGTIELGGRFPVTTDGGLLSFSHSGTGQLLQRVIRGVEQLQGTCRSGQVPGTSVVLCSNGGGASMFTDVMLLGKAS